MAMDAEPRSQPLKLSAQTRPTVSDNRNSN
jgi:hypothetical protein